MISDPDIVDLAAATYSNFQWDFLYKNDKVYCGVKHVNGIAVAAFRGSVTTPDWMHDLDALPFATLDIGTVHMGFFEGVPESIPALLPNLKGPLVITGHSLGAAHAALFAGRLTVMGVPVSRLVLCGSPRPGFSRLASILVPIPKASYKNRFDPVTCVPLDPPYMQVCPFTTVNVEPPLDDFDPLADHSIFRYQQGVREIWGSHGA